MTRPVQPDAADRMTRPHQPPGGSSRLASIVHRIAPWRVVLAVLGLVAVLHALWALGISWPASSSDELAELVVGRRPFPPSAMTWGIVVALVGAIAVVVGSMRTDLSPRIRRLCCIGSTLVVAVLFLRGVLGEFSSIIGLEGSTSQYRILDLLVYSPLCLWAAAGIYYRQPAPGDSGPLQ